MTYKEQIFKSLSQMAEDADVLFMGYGVVYNSVLDGVPTNQRLEMPLAENLMLGTAIGMALEGYKPVVCFERMDFLLNAMDSLVNHLDKIKIISDNQFDPAVIVRCVVGNDNKPLYTGETHVQDFSASLSYMIDMCVDCIDTRRPASKIDELYRWTNESKVLVEYKDFYDEPL